MPYRDHAKARRNCVPGFSRGPLGYNIMRGAPLKLPPSLRSEDAGFSGVLFVWSLWEPLASGGKCRPATFRGPRDYNIMEGLTPPNHPASLRSEELVAVRKCFAVSLEEAGGIVEGYFRCRAAHVGYVERLEVVFIEVC